MFRNVNKRSQIRAWPITGFVGPNGSGKSAGMVWATLPTLSSGRRVLSTVRLLDFENPRDCEGCDSPNHVMPVLAPAEGPFDLGAGRPQAVIGTRIHRQAHPCYVPFTHWQQLLDAEHCDVLMDEVTGVASSRESQSMPAPVANKLVQLRRADVVVRWSAPSWARADKIIRECSQMVVYSRGYLAKQSGDADRQWRERRMFRWQMFDASDFEDFTAGKREQLRPALQDWHWGPGSPVFDAYDTYDSVSTIGTVTDSGRCYNCGGSRRVPKCSCPDAHDAEHGHGDAESAGPTQWVRDGVPTPTLLRTRLATR